MAKNIKVLHEVSIFDSHVGRINRVIQYNGVQKFKLIYDLRNGVADISVYIMNSDGEFRPVLSKYDIGHVFCSYVSKELEMKKNAEAAIKLAEEVIVKVW